MARNGNSRAKRCWSDVSVPQPRGGGQGRALRRSQHIRHDGRLLPADLLRQKLIVPSLPEVRIQAGCRGLGSP
eukprot:2392118-Pyramimonas_sp.AAC.1